MKAGLELRWSWLLLLAFAACGGQVDLGNRADGRTPPGSDKQPPADDSRWVKSELVVSPASVDLGSELAVAGDFLYVPGTESKSLTASLFRCKKASCPDSWERLPTIDVGLGSLQVVGDRLAVWGFEDQGGGFLGSYALPDATDRQVVLDRLPDIYTAAQVYRSFVYWPYPDDDAYYRCALPSCSGGPRKIIDTRYDWPLAVDGDSLFVANGQLILRIGALGDGPVERLLPDAELSVAPAGTTETSLYPDAWLAASNGMLYAALPECNIEGCPGKIVRWPATGGPREELITFDNGIGGLFVFDNELVWFDSNAGARVGVRLASCRVEACSSTLRYLGVGSPHRGTVTSDDQRLYWLEYGEIAGSADFIRSVKRLPAP